MTLRALTIAREYGSAGGEIAGIVASRLGWRLVDKDLLTEIGRRAQVSVGDTIALDERIDPWIHRITRPLWGTGADGMSAISRVDLFDADAEASVAKLVIEEAYCQGSCVIVGRGSQCVLQAKRDAFRVFVYASWDDRVRRVQEHLKPGVNVNELLRVMDEQRLEYVRRHYKEDRLDPHLYDLMVNSHSQPEAAARLILSAIAGQ